MDERPLGVTVITIADSVLGLLIFMLGILCWAVVAIDTNLFELVRLIIPSDLLYDVQFCWLSIAFGLSLMAGALGLSKMRGWGYFLVLLNRFLLIILCISYLKMGMMYLLIGFVIPTMLVAAYLFRTRGLFFETEPVQIQPKKEEIVVPELPPTLTKPSEKTVRAEEIQKILTTKRIAPINCPNCGGENPLDASVCFHCGTYLKKTSHGVSELSVSESKLVKKTATKSQMPMVFCIYCGTKNPSKAEYCFRCGKKIWTG